MDHDVDVTTPVHLLDRPLYGVGQAAGLLGLSSATTLWRWLDGYDRGGKHYAPVIRERTTGEEILTWGEFVEASYLSRLRANVSLQHLRGVVDKLRNELGTPYPLAHAKPFAEGKEVVRRAQVAADLPDELRIVVVRNDQISLSPTAESWITDVDYLDDIAIKLHPAGRRSPVVIDPIQGFGMPSLEGRNLRTEVIAELYEAGDSAQDIAHAYDLEVAQVEAAIRFELKNARGDAA